MKLLLAKTEYCLEYDHLWLNTQALQRMWSKISQVGSLEIRVVSYHFYKV